MAKILEGNTASLALSNTSGIKILVNDNGDGVQYQYVGTEAEEINESEIEYLEDTDNVTGYADTEDGLIQPSFKTKEGVVYFIGEFIRDNYGR